jgi:hypothetical protein
MEFRTQTQCSEWWISSNFIIIITFSYRNIHFDDLWKLLGVFSWSPRFFQARARLLDARQFGLKMIANATRLRGMPWRFLLGWE